MKAILISVLIAPLVSSFATSTALADDPVLRFGGLDYEGTGCPTGSVHVSLVSPGVRFDSLVAEAKNGRADTKACQVTIKLSVDPGWSFAIPAMHYRGSAELGGGAVGTQTSTYFFKDAASPNARRQTKLDGPFSGAFSRADEMGDVLWSPCGVTEHLLVINAEIRVVGQAGQMRIDEVSGDVVQASGLLWRKCQ